MTDRASTQALIDQLGARFVAAVRNVAAAGSPYALIDFPDHSNVGDSAIWLGEVEALSAVYNALPAYTCRFDGYDPGSLQAAVSEGTIFLHGGGNFGDLWPAHQAFKERVCSDFPGRVIVQLPQSIHFESDANRERSFRIIDRQRAFTLMVREHQSAQRAQRFDCSVVLVPDAAFALGAFSRNATAVSRCMALLRDDKESRGHRSTILAHLPSGTPVEDWVAEDVDLVNSLGAYVAQRQGISVACNRVAELRLARGLATLASGETLVTDRLHGHILALLSGIPHFVLDNSYRKISSFIETWTAGSNLVTYGLPNGELKTWHARVTQG